MDIDSFPSGVTFSLRGDSISNALDMLTSLDIFNTDDNALIDTLKMLFLNQVTGSYILLR